MKVSLCHWAEKVVRMLLIYEGFVFKRTLSSIRIGLVYSASIEDFSTSSTSSIIFDLLILKTSAIFTSSFYYSIMISSLMLDFFCYYSIAIGIYLSGISSSVLQSSNFSVRTIVWGSSFYSATYPSTKISGISQNSNWKLDARLPDLGDALWLMKRS